ncbi:MAG: hypothetical protein GY811_01555 [Myxococcales bacterium]|nr:hypothetical protein [Myxococcales bacterium]
MVITTTGDGPPSCDGTNNHLNHAKCAIQQVGDAHADIQVAMGRFRDGDDAPLGPPVGTDCVGAAFGCAACDTGDGTDCTAEMNMADRFRLLVPAFPIAALLISSLAPARSSFAPCTRKIRTHHPRSFFPLDGLGALMLLLLATWYREREEGL